MLYLGKHIYVLGDFNCKFSKVENVTFKLKSVEIFEKWYEEIFHHSKEIIIPLKTCYTFYF